MDGICVNIITPCSRPENLEIIHASIKQVLHDVDWKWLVCFDGCVVKGCDPKNFENTSFFRVTNEKSKSGNAQRNYCLTVLQNSGWVYFLDDDTIMHKGLREAVTQDADMITFTQIDNRGYIRLNATETPQVGYVDSGNFLVKAEIAKQVEWVLDAYEADGMYAKKCRELSNNFKAVNGLTASIYNELKR